MAKEKHFLKSCDFRTELFAKSFVDNCPEMIIARYMAQREYPQYWPDVHDEVSTAELIFKIKARDKTIELLRDEIADLKLKSDQLSKERTPIQSPGIENRTVSMDSISDNDTITCNPVPGLETILACGENSMKMNSTAPALTVDLRSRVDLIAKMFSQGTIDTETHSFTSSSACKSSNPDENSNNDSENVKEIVRNNEPTFKPRSLSIYRDPVSNCHYHPIIDTNFKCSQIEEHSIEQIPHPPAYTALLRDPVNPESSSSDSLSTRQLSIFPSTSSEINQKPKSLTIYRDPVNIHPKSAVPQAGIFKEVKLEPPKLCIRPQLIDPVPNDIVSEIKPSNSIISETGLISIQSTFDPLCYSTSVFQPMQPQKFPPTSSSSAEPAELERPQLNSHPLNPLISNAFNFLHKDEGRSDCRPVAGGFRIDETNFISAVVSQFNMNRGRENQKP